MATITPAPGRKFVHRNRGVYVITRVTDEGYVHYQPWPAGSMADRLYCFVDHFDKHVRRWVDEN